MPEIASPNSNTNRDSTARRKKERSGLQSACDELIGQPFRRAAGVFATSTRATGARLKLCQAQAVGRVRAESLGLCPRLSAIRSFSRRARNRQANRFAERPEFLRPVRARQGLG